MVGILIATHGGFGDGLISGSELLVGKQEKMASMGLYHGDSIEGFEDIMQNHIKILDDGDGVLILVDFIGGSPANTVLKCMRMENKIEALTDINMPMLVEIVSSREGATLTELTELGLDIGKMSPTLLHEEFKAMYMASEDNEEDEDF